MRVFLDTNVLVAAFATRGLCADVMRVVLAEHQLITGEIVLSELRKALGRRIKLPAATIEDILALIREQNVVPKPGKPSNLQFETLTIVGYSRQHWPDEPTCW